MHTHRATCQICQSQQAYDNKTGTIAAHGYTVVYGYFHGRCKGSMRRPLNETCEYLNRVAGEVAADVEQMQQELTALTDRKEIKKMEYRIERGSSFVTFAKATVAAWQPFALVPTTVIANAKRERNENAAAERAARKLAAAEKKAALEAKRAAALIWTDEMVAKATAKAAKLFKSNAVVIMHSKEYWGSFPGSHCANIEQVEQWLAEHRNTGKIEVLTFDAKQPPCLCETCESVR